VFNLGMGEITVILLLALIFLGPKKLPDLASGLGRLIRELRKATSDVKNEIALDDTFRKPFEELRDAVTLHPDELKRRDQIRQSLEDARRKAEEVDRAQQAQAAQGGEATPPPVTSAADAALAAVEPPAADVPPPPVAVPAHVPPPVPEAHVSPPPPPPPRPAAPEAHAAAGMSPAVPMAPPPGTIAAPPTRLGAPRVTPPISSVESESANKTQSLSEADILPPAKPPALPVRRSTPPPLPGVVKPKKS
jgi:sec-independent protein translocase protein TatB